MKKLLPSLVLVPLALVFVLMALVNLAPQTVVVAVNEMVDEFQVEAQEFEMSWFPLTLRATGLQVAMPGLQINGSELMVRLRWHGLWSQRPFWSVVGQRVAVLPQPLTATAVMGSAEAGNAGSALPLELLLAFEKVLVEELQYADRVTASVQAVREDGRLMLEVALDSNQPAMIADLRLHSGLSIGAGITLDIQDGALQVASEGQPRVQFDFDAGRLHWKPVREFEVALSIARADVPDALQYLFPLSFDIAVSIEPERINVTRLGYESATDEFVAELSLATGDAPSVAGRLTAERLFIPFFGDEAQPAAVLDQSGGDGSAAAPTGANSGRFFSDVPLDWSWLEETRIDVAATAETLLVQSAEFTGVQVQIEIGAGKAQVKPFKGKFGQGGFNGELYVSAKADESVDVAATFDMQGIDLEDFGFLPADELQGGALEARARLTAEGASPAQLVAALDGEFGVDIGATTLANDLLDLAGSDLLTEALNRLNPFRKEDRLTRVQCGVLHFKVENGVIRSEDKLVVETSKMRVEGETTINLASEDLDMTFAPRAKGGLGVGVSNLVKFVKLGGKLSNPVMEVDALGVAQSGVAVGAAVATGGVSLLAEGLANRVLGDSGCAQQTVERAVEEPLETIDSENE